MPSATSMAMRSRVSTLSSTLSSSRTCRSDPCAQSSDTIQMAWAVRAQPYSCSTFGWRR